MFILVFIIFVKVISGLRVESSVGPSYEDMGSTERSLGRDVQSQLLQLTKKVEHQQKNIELLMKMTMTTSVNFNDFRAIVEKKQEVDEKEIKTLKVKIDTNKERYEKQIAEMKAGIAADKEMANKKIESLQTEIAANKEVANKQIATVKNEVTVIEIKEAKEISKLKAQITANKMKCEKELKKLKETSENQNKRILSLSKITDKKFNEQTKGIRTIKDEILKQIDAGIKGLQSEIKSNRGTINSITNKQNKEDEKLAELTRKLLQDEISIEGNKVQINVVEKDLEVEKKKSIKMQTDLSSDLKLIEHNQDGVKIINEQMKYLVFDAKTVTIFNKVNVTSNIYQDCEGVYCFGAKPFESLERNHMWRLVMEKNSQCYQIFNVQYQKWKIAAWPNRLFLYTGDLFFDQLWRFQYDGDGYYRIFNCYYTDKRIHLKPDGTLVGVSGKYDDRQLWKLTSVPSLK